MVTNTRYQRIVEMLNRRQPDLTMIMDGVHKTHNLAAIARTCDAVGIGWIHAVSPDGYLHLGHKRASGTEKWVAVASHANIEDAYRHLKREGFTIVAAVLRADALEFDQIDYTRPTAIAVGNELDGLSGEALDGADACVRIPVQGAVESLNVSVATALILYEAMRQRRAVGFYERRRISDEDFTRLAFEWTHPPVAAYCRRKGLSYPPLDDHGDLAQTIGDNRSGSVGEFLARTND